MKDTIQKREIKCLRKTYMESLWKQQCSTKQLTRYGMEDENESKLKDLCFNDGKTKLQWLCWSGNGIN